MTQRHRSKLIEVALPLADMNAAGRAEKAVPRKGLPATMHIWWSRKPTGLARAVLFASLIDDPAERPDLWPDQETQAERRRELLGLVADLARWDCRPERIDEARRIVARQCGPDGPAIVDPFCGGGALPLEARRLGLDVVAGDLNPLAALLTRGLVELPPAVSSLGPVHPDADGGVSGPAGLATDVELFGQDLLRDVEARIGHHYPSVTVPPGAPRRRRDMAAGYDGAAAGTAPDGPCLSPAISYLWARTATCTNRVCQAELPLLSTWALSRRPTNRWHLAPTLRTGPPGRLDLTVRAGPPPDDLPDLKVGKGANYRCPFCGEVTDADALREQGRRQQLDLRLVAIQTLAEPRRSRNQAGRAWTTASPEQIAAAAVDPSGDRAFPLPDTELPLVTGNIAAFGLSTLADLLTPRQKLLMSTMCEALTDLYPRIEKAAGRTAPDRPPDDRPLRDGGRGPRAYAETITTYLALAISRMANRVSTMTVHNRHNGSVEQSFVQPGYAFYGEFPEANPFSDSTGSFGNALRHVVQALAGLPAAGGAATVTCAPASHLLDGLREEGRQAIVYTDPPYYDMFDYAALSNLFYPWLRHTLREIWPDETRWLLAPDEDQIVSNPGRFGGSGRRAHDHFATGMKTTLAAVRAVQDDDYPLTLYYGYLHSRRQANGRGATAWVALLDALVTSGFRITSTWPLRTERPEGVKTGSNALASSMVLSCRPRPDEAPSTSREAFTAELRTAVRRAVADFQATHLAPVDLPQSVIGPGMAVYSTYSRVLEADGTSMAVSTALDLIHEVLEEAVVEQVSGVDVVTAWVVRWAADFGTGPGPRDRAAHEAVRLGFPVGLLRDTSIVTCAGDDLRLSTRAELADGADGVPRTGWEALGRLLHALDQDSESTPREVVADRLGSWPAPVVEFVPRLAYHHFLVCQRRRWPAEAALCNTLIRAWPSSDHPAP